MNVIEKRPGRVLVVEDNAKWRNGLRDRLRRKGYYVQTAATRQEAAERLEFDYYHVLILDIRLEEEDTYNVEGMEILSELGGRKLDMTMSIVMISAYGTMEQMREAFRDYDIVDFQSKLNFDLIPFVEDVKRILIEKTKINLELRVEWKNGSSAESCTAKLRLGKNLVASDPVLHKRVSAELDDLLCRLFFDKEVVKIEPMSPGFSGTGVLRVTAFDAEHGIALPVVCKYGDTGKISKEEQNFREFVEGHVGGNRSTIALGGRQTPVLGGLLFSFQGVEEQFQELGDFYRRTEGSRITEVFKRLFLNTCGLWYQSREEMKAHDLSAEYQEFLGFTVEGLSQACESQLGLSAKEPELRLPGVDGRDFINPVRVLARHLQGDGGLKRDVYRCTTHGDFNDRNVLVDESGAAWLIDFLRTGKGHMLRDFGELDTCVRIQLLGEDEATLAERLALEEALLELDPGDTAGVERLASGLPENPALRKAFETTAHLRRLALIDLAQGGSPNAEEYGIALLYYALNLVRYNDVPATQRYHALMTASLLIERWELF